MKQKKWVIFTMLFKFIFLSYHATSPFTDCLFSTALHCACFYAIWFLHLRHKSDYPTNTSAVLLYVMHPKMHVNENRLYLFMGWVGKYHSVSTVFIYFFILIKVRNISRKRKSSEKSPWNLCLTNHSSLTLILLSQRT